MAIDTNNPQLTLRGEKGSPLTQDEGDESRLAVIADGGSGIHNVIPDGDFQTNTWASGTSFTDVGDGDPLATGFTFVKENTTAVFDANRENDSPTNAEVGVYSEQSLRVNVTTSDGTVDADDLVSIKYIVSGADYTRVAQNPFTISFWVKSPVTGVYCLGMRNSGRDQSYVAEYTINSANTWEKKEISVPASPSAGTWNYEGGTGLEMDWVLMAGTNSQGAAGAWTASDFVATASQVNFSDNTSNEFRVGFIKLERGARATAFRKVGSAQISQATEPTIPPSFVGGIPQAEYDSSVTLDNGIIIKYGQSEVIPTNATRTVTFTTPFPNAIYSVQVCMIDDTTTFRPEAPGGVTPLTSLASFDIWHSDNNEAHAYYWIAVGS